MTSPNRKSFCRCAAVSICVVLLPGLAEHLSAQPPDDNSVATAAPVKSSPLGVRQRRVKRMVQELDRILTRLSQSLLEKEPEQATKLAKALQESKRLLIEKRMHDISESLDRFRLETASAEQVKVIEDLERLLEALVAEDDALARVKEEIAQLKQLRAQLDNILAEQRSLLSESRQLTDKEAALRDLDKQVDEVNKLIKKQKEIKDATASQSDHKADTLDKLADQQHALRMKTRSIARQVSGSQPTGDQNAESPDKQGNDNPSPTSAPGSKSLCSACKSQQSAENQLGARQPKQAETSEAQAVKQLERALSDLKRQRDRVAEMSPKDFKRLARKQDDTAQQLAALSQPGPSQNGSRSQAKSGQNSPSKAGQSPLQAQMNKSKAAMQQASKCLSGQNPGQAKENQQEAVNHLENALAQLRKRLKELEDQTLDEKLASLENIFREMLSRQQVVTHGTARFEKKKIEAQKADSEKQLSRADRLTLRNLGDEEKSLADRAGEAEDLLAEEGRSIVFLGVVSNLRRELADVAELLRQQKTGVYTQELQKEIELTLDELIAALQTAKKPLDPKQSGGPSQCKCKGKLLPQSAELKLLRETQLRINRRTKSLDKARAEAPLDTVLTRQFRGNSDLQAEILKMAREIAERVREPEDPEHPLEP